MNIDIKIINCETIEDLLPAFLEDEVSSKEKLMVIEHLLNCNSCSQFIERLEALDKCFLAPCGYQTNEWQKSRGESVELITNSDKLITKSDEPASESEIAMSRKLLLEGIHEALGYKQIATATDVLTPEEVSVYLKVSVETVYEMSGDMPFFYFGNDLRIRRERLIQWIDEQEFDSHRKALAVVGGRL